MQDYLVYKLDHVAMTIYAFCVDYQNVQSLRLYSEVCISFYICIRDLLRL